MQKKNQDFSTSWILYELIENCITHWHNYLLTKISTLVFSDLVQIQFPHGPFVFFYNFKCQTYKKTIIKVSFSSHNGGILSVSLCNPHKLLSASTNAEDWWVNTISTDRQPTDITVICDIVEYIVNEIEWFKNMNSSCVH